MSAVRQPSVCGYDRQEIYCLVTAVIIARYWTEGISLWRMNLSVKLQHIYKVQDGIASGEGLSITVRDDTGGWAGILTVMAHTDGAATITA
jgi:hypothetical protein